MADMSDEREQAIEAAQDAASEFRMMADASRRHVMLCGESGGGWCFIPHCMCWCHGGDSLVEISRDHLRTSANSIDAALSVLQTQSAELDAARAERDEWRTLAFRAIAALGHVRNPTAETVSDWGAFKARRAELLTAAGDDISEVMARQRAALASADDVQARPPAECEALDCSAAPITQFGEWWFCETHGDALGAGDVPTKRAAARPPEVST